MHAQPRPAGDFIIRALALPLKPAGRSLQITGDARALLIAEGWTPPAPSPADFDDEGEDA
jgi:hypothetical protein